METGRRAPEGTVALLFTDIEGSTRLASELGSGWAEVLAEHHELVGGAIAEAGGFVDGTEGDAFFATFADPVAAARAAVCAQRALRTHSWPEPVGELRVRMGLHVGPVQRTKIGYVGLEVHRAARVAAAAHGGQLLLTGAARELAGEELVTESVGVHRLKDFPAPVQLFCAVIDGRGAAAFPPPRTESVRPTNLPASDVALVGRDAELEEIVAALSADGERLVTITGRGGAGKTSVALLAGGKLLDAHPGGVWWVDLTTVTGPEGVLSAVAAVVGAGGETEVSVGEAVEVRLRHSGPTLVILDNFEHALGAAGEVAGLLGRLHGLRVLVTSRMPLREGSERVIQLDALGEGPALEVIERSLSRRGRPAGMTDTDREALGEIVRLLDGLPLALELAAGRLSMLSAVQLRDRLRDSIAVLGEDRGGRPVRQRSLRAVLDSTLSLLDPSARVLFVRLGVFAGPVELEEIETILAGDGSDVLGALAELIDAALVQRVETGDGVIRFGLPEALRQLASELLDGEPEAERWRRAHAQRQYELIWPYRMVWVDGKTARAARGAEREAGAALRWAAANHDPLETPLAAAYANMLLRGQVREAGAITERLIAAPPADPEVRSLALLAHSVYLGNSGRNGEAVRFADDAYRAAPDAAARSHSLIIRGLFKLFDGQIAEAVQDHAEATALARGLDDPAFLTGALLLESQTLAAAGLVEEAAALFDEARTVGSPVDASALSMLNSLSGDLALAGGRPADALEPYSQSSEQSLASGRMLQISNDLMCLAEALAALGHDEESLELAGMAESQAAEIGAAVDSLYDQHLTALRQRIGPARADELKQRAQASNPAERVARGCQLARSHAPSAATDPVANAFARG